VGNRVLLTAVHAAGYLNYKADDFHGAVCEFVCVLNNGRITAKYTFKYYDFDVEEWDTGALWVTPAPDGALLAEW
jgi:hypothetical protein